MITCIAIDDEPLALKQIASYIIKTPALELVGQFENAIEAMTFLSNSKVDLMFVDINMPDLSGMDFVKSLVDPPKVIFTTAYSEYALDGFRVNAICFNANGSSSMAIQVIIVVYLILPNRYHFLP